MGFCLSGMLIDYSFDSLLCEYVLVSLALNKYITDICILDLHSSDLDTCTTLRLEPSDCLTILSYDQSYGVISHRNDEGLT